MFKLLCLPMSTYFFKRHLENVLMHFFLSELNVKIDTNIIMMLQQELPVCNMRES